MSVSLLVLQQWQPGGDGGGSVDKKLGRQVA
jgi:hypothetical protein